MKIAGPEKKGSERTRKTQGTFQKYNSQDKVTFQDETCFKKEKTKTLIEMTSQVTVSLSRNCP